MTKRLKSIILATFAFVVTVGVAVPVFQADAQTTSSSALSIVPRKDYVVEPGSSVDDTLVIRNLDRELPLELTLRVVDFTSQDDGGTPRLLLDPDAEQTPWSLKPFLTLPESVSIPPGTSRTLDMNVAIPEGHGAGSYYSAIVYSSGASEGGNVGLNASGVTLAFASIPGEVDETVTLEKFGAYQQSSSSYTRFMANQPQVIGFTLKNEGNVTQAPIGSITIKNILFGKETTITNVNPNNSLALIGQTRTFTPCIKLTSENLDFQGTRAEATTCASPGLWPGIYTGEIDLLYGWNGNVQQEINGKTWFIYAPWWFILIVVVILLALAFLIWKIVNKVRSSRRGAAFKKSSRRKK